MAKTSELIDAINKEFISGKFDPYISSLRFPYFKNLELNLEITFDFPITAIVGENGTNKSSILRALEGCPSNESISNYWFDTELDRMGIEYGSQRYIHQYRVPSGKKAEVLKQRIYKESRGDDYFETVRPRPRDDMLEMPTMCEEDKPYRSLTRWKPIEKSVRYLDFRSQLPAYDIFMNFDWRNSRFNTPALKKAEVRRQSLRIKRALSNLERERILYGKQRILSPAEQLTPDETDAISMILEREYESIRIVEHDFYNCIGQTVMLTTKQRNYSEAFAGSGEFAIVMLVKEIMRASDKTLILLDEPETSLHPGAQKALMEFILKEVAKKHHQVVLTTHSRDLIELLPDKARKLLGINKMSGRVQLVSAGATAEEAFVRLGATHDKKRIVVEDRLAKAFIQCAARTRGESYLSSFEVSILPGGVDGITKKHIPHDAQIGADTYVIIDGDQKPEQTVKVDHLSDEEIYTELEKIGIQKNNIFRDGGNGDQETRTLNEAIKILNWASERVGYLPGKGNPEQLLLEITEQSGGETPSSAKVKWESIARKDLGRLEEESISSDEIFTIQQQYLNEAHKNDVVQDILQTLDKLLHPGRNDLIFQSNEN